MSLADICGPPCTYPKAFGKHFTHPLSRLFGLRGFSVQAGMAWLQDRGHVSDECLWPEDVAPCDLERIFVAAGHEELVPDARKLVGSKMP